MGTTKKPDIPKIPKNADDREQSERFIEAARKHVADGEATLEETFKKAVPPRRKAK